MAATETICGERDNKHAEKKTRARTYERIIAANISTFGTFFKKGLDQITLQGKSLISRVPLATPALNARSDLTSGRGL